MLLMRMIYSVKSTSKIHVKLRYAVIAAIAVAAAGYLAMAAYYSKGFNPGTFVNGVYCTGKSVTVINEELQGQYNNDIFVIQDALGRQYEISLSDIGFYIDYTNPLHELQDGQNPFVWAGSLIQPGRETINPEVGFDMLLLEKALENCGIEQANAKEPTVEIRLEQGYVLYNGKQDVFDLQAVRNRVAEMLMQGRYFMDVSDCYANLPYTQDEQDTLVLWEKIEAFQNCGIQYDMGDGKIALTPELTSNFIALDENGNFLLDEDGNPVCSEEGITAFIDALCLEYDTYGSVRDFYSTRGDIITIEGGTYGNKLDREAEIAYLTEAFLEGKQEVHVPAYIQQAAVRGKNDIGDTYVEVDMGTQKLYYYEDGELKLETDIVTGNISRRMGTPSGVFYVYNMQRNRVLRGEGYASPVKYWVPVKGSIGIHDASWRKDFGGEIYKTGGSHGCINVPGSVMGELYDMLEIGVPVVMFY